jgi:geranylgeranyl diphosphate synthase type I
MMNIQQFQEWFDGRFINVLKEKIDVFVRVSDNAALREALEHLPTYAAHGKRFRPYMAYVGYGTEGGEHDIFPLLASIEFLHLFCLVQDDIIDNESERHGTMTMHKKVAAQYHSREIGRSVAMLVGDLLMAWSYECFQEIKSIEPHTSNGALEEFRLLLSDVLHGQLLDVLLLTEENPEQNIIFKSMYLKSAQYSFFRPLYIGMLLAGADAKAFAEEYAINLGMGFQLQDDIADHLTDIKDGQPTLISWYMFNVAPLSERKEFELYFSKEWSEEEEEKLTAILEDSGALSFAQESMEEYFLKAEDAIFAYDKHDEAVWQEIIDMVTER